MLRLIEAFTDPVKVYDSLLGPYVGVKMRFDKNLLKYANLFVHYVSGLFQYYNYIL
jgi:hypothetical protein